MPVSTRSQINTNPEQNEPNQDQREDHPLRNPHHGLKEKMKALTLLYEQQKKSSLSLKKEANELKQSNVMKENTMPNSTVTRAFVLPQPPIDEEKENIPAANGDGIVGFSCPRKSPVSTTVVRKLSIGSSVLPQSDPRGVAGTQNVNEFQAISEKQSTGGSRILVFVRLRPTAKREKEGGSRSCVRIVNRREVYLTEFATENDYLRLKRLRGRHFTFDASFPDLTTQQEVYSTTTAELVEAVLQGRNGSVFCYGATGAGKTYTMLGTVENPGVMVLAIKDLFNQIRQRSCDSNHEVHLSYLEVYNETVRDLLSPGRPLVLREDKQGIVAHGLTQYRAYSTDEVMDLLLRGNQNRTTEPTHVNETSSRSHAILQEVSRFFMVEYRVKDASNNVVNRVGKLSLIDLAGSERALATDQRTLRSLEGANINRSLLALSSCINALVEGKKHVPYRNSKLTQLLKDSLGGACNTAYDANEEILQVPESETDQAKLLLELQKENRELRVQLARQKQKILIIQAQSLAANASPTPSSIASHLSTPLSTQPNKKLKPKSTFLAGNCFTPESKTVGELQRAVKALEAEIEKMRKDYELQIKQKDEFILELSLKRAKTASGEEEGMMKRVVTRESLRPKKKIEGEEGMMKRVVTRESLRPKKKIEGELKSSSQRQVLRVRGRKEDDELVE
ncbi:Kinesin-like protein KIN-8A [Camellia lanceoleosa]|uniref:Kinesin-like protein KIN-8A n=1 Tax=Camellia lanceoleosa TaxID=1840588 RepID=A0ACC0FBL3_9ERIC|nr:Kinesin-like protein KIN-8A [Camellia lanceoleosa]